MSGLARLTPLAERSSLNTHAPKLQQQQRKTKEQTMSNPSRVTCIDVAESIARSRNFAREMYSEGYITKQTMDRYLADINVLARQSTNYVTAPLTAADL